MSLDAISCFTYVRTGAPQTPFARILPGETLMPIGSLNIHDIDDNKNVKNLLIL